MKKLLKLTPLLVLMMLLTSCWPPNTIVDRDESVNESWANVQSSYQRRLDLIDNLVNTVKGAAEFEKETFLAITKARAGIQEPTEAMLADKDALAEFYAAQKQLQSQARTMFNISVENYEPRSFNMGISKEAFQATGGFGSIHPGEDPDLSIRLKEMGYHLHLIPEAFVYHKRRISLESFYIQVNKFGQARSILNKWHPRSKRLSYWFPSIFTLGLVISSLLAALDFYWFLLLFGIYFLAAMIGAFRLTNNIIASFLVIPAIAIQFLGYGLGFLKSTLKLAVSSKSEKQLFPNLFFRSQ